MAQSNNNTVDFTLKSILKGWFETGKFPTQTQFHALFDSYWHKGEQIPTSKIAGLDQLLNAAVTYKIYKGNVIFKQKQILSGSLVVGKSYFIRQEEFDNRDDFYNVGFSNFGQVFTATATTPSIWNETIIWELNFTTKVFENTTAEDYCWFEVDVINGNVYLKSANKFQNASELIWHSGTAHFIDNSTIRVWNLDSEIITGGVSDKQPINSFEFRFYNDLK